MHLFPHQILRIDHAQLASQWIQYKIGDCNEYMRATAARDADEDGDDELEKQFHVRVGSRQKPQTFEHVELERGINPAFNHFRIKLNNFLNFSVISRILLDGKKITLNVKDEVDHTNLNYPASILNSNKHSWWSTATSKWTMNPWLTGASTWTTCGVVRCFMEFLNMMVLLSRRKMGTSLGGWSWSSAVKLQWAMPPLFWYSLMMLW